MHSGFGLPGSQQENPLQLSPNPAHILDGAHHLLLHQHHPFLPPQARLSHHFAPADYSPAVNFKLGLNAINDYNKDGGGGGGGDASNLLRGSEQFAGPEARQSSLGMLHCSWQNQQDSPNKQTPFWEPLPAEVSNENSEIIDRQEMTQKETLSACLGTKARVHFGELEAIYKRLGTSDSVQARPSGTPPVIQPGWQVPAAGLDHGSEASIGEASTKKRRKRKKRRDGVGYDRIINPMADFFGDLVKQVMDHQEHLQKKFMDVIERLEEERRAREEAWRKEESAHLERKAAVRAHEKAQARSREAMIVSYLEKITGERVDLPPMENGEDD